MVLSDLNEGEYSFLRLAENLPGIVYRVLIEDDNRMIFFNDMVQNMTGYRPEDLKQGEVCSIDPIIVPEDKSNVINIVKDAIDNNVPFEVEYRINNKSGELKWFFERGRPIRGDNGNPPYIEGVIFDITDQKEVEKKLKTSEEQYRILSTELETILDHYPGLAFYKDTNNNFIRINQNVVDYYNSDSVGVKVNLTKKDIEGKNLSDLLPEDIAQAYWDDDLEVINSGTPKLNIEESFKTEHGIKWLNSNKIPYFDENGEIRGIIGFSIDITERKVAEKKLEESQGIFEQLNKVFLKFKEDPIFNLQLLINTAGLLLNADCALFNMLKRVNGKEVLESLVTYNEPPNFTRESDPKGHICTDIIKDNPDNVVILRNLDKTDYIKTDENVRKYDLKQYVSYVVRFNNKPTATFCVVYTENREMSKSDINILQILSKSASTELARWNSRIDLQKSEKKFKLLYENAPLGYLSLDLKGNILEVNKACINFFGYSKEEVIGNWFGDFIDSEYLEVFTANFLKFKETGEICEEEMGVVKKDGSHAIVLFDGNISYDENGNFKQIHCIFQDITEQREIQNEIREKQATLESIFRAAPIGIGVVKNRVFTQVNDVFCRLVGYTRKELLNKNARIIYPSDEEYEYVGKEKYGQIAKFGIGTVETRFRRKDGIIIDILLSSVQLDPNNISAGVTFTAMDITERKKIEFKLKESEEKYRNLTEQSLIGVAVIQDNVFKYINQRYAEIGGYTVEEMINWQPEEFIKTVHPADREKVMTQSIKKQRGDKNVESQYTFQAISKTGEAIWIELYSKTITYESRLAVLITIIDITDRKKAEQKLIESEEKYKYLFNNAQVGLYWSNISDGKFLECNETFAKLFGYNTREECLADYIATEHYIDPHQRIELLEAIRTNKEVRGYEILVTKRGGTPIWLSISARMFEKENRIEGAAIDITERKRIENQLRSSEVFLSNVFTSIQDGISVLDKDLNIIQVNPIMEKWYSHSMPMLGRKCYEVYHERSEACEICPSIQALKSGEPAYEVVPKRGPNQKTIGWLDLYSFPLLDERGGQIIGVIEYVRDITERKQAERNLQLERDNFLNILNSMEDGIYIVDKNYDIEYVNPSLIKEFGQFEGMKCFKYLHDLNDICPWCKIQEVFEGKTVRWEWYSPKNQKTYDLIDTPLRNPDGSLSKLEIFRDISESKKVEQVLKESEEKYREAYNRAEFYKDIFAHDINNILQSILSGTQISQLILDNPKKIDELKLNAEIIKEQVIRGAKLVSNVRKLSKLEEAGRSLEKIEILKVLKNMVSFVKKSYKDKNLVIRVDSIGEKLFFKANIFLEDVFENLFINAIRHNMNLMIEITVRILRERRVGINYLKIEFLDNGFGVADSMKEKIFQRGYSKEKGVYGMGLGLSLVRGIIETYKGKIWVEDRVKGDRSKGSNFILLIPEVD